jgi:hypothetical protein
MANRSLSFRDAVNEIERALGVDLRLDNPSPRKPTNVNKLTTAARFDGLPYYMSREESGRAYEAARALNGASDQIERISVWRGLRPETIRSLILDCALGIEGNNLAFLFETGMKLRPIGASSKQSRWAFGKPFLWRVWPLVDRNLSGCVQTIHLTEGEFDCVRLVECGFEAEDLSEIVVAIPGANCFRPEWANLFHGKTVFLWLDDDSAGHRSTQRIGVLLHEAGVHVMEWNLTAAIEAV